MGYNGILNNNRNIMKKYFNKDTGEELKIGEITTVKKKLANGEVAVTCVMSQKVAEMLMEYGFDIEEREETQPQEMPSELVNSIFLAIEKLQKQVDALQKATGKQFNCINRRINSLKEIVDNGKQNTKPSSKGV